MGLILGCVFYLFTAGITLTVLAIATVLFAFVVSWVYNLPYYGPYEAFGDVQWIMISLLIHDRFVGPYSKTLRKVASYLPGRKTVTTSETSYEFDR